MFVQRYSRWPICPYSSLFLTVALVILQFTKYAHIHFLLIMLPVTLLLFERLAFAELLAAKDAEIRRLQHDDKASV
jgi:hypothetical protein